MRKQQQQQKNSIGVRKTAASPNYAQVDLAGNLSLFEQCLAVTEKITIVIVFLFC
jgi:hypothetical protein